MTAWERWMFYLMLVCLPLQGLNTCAGDIRLTELQKEITEIKSYYND